MRPRRPRARYRGVLGLWLTLTTLPALAQVTPLTGQNVFSYRPPNANGGNYLWAVGGLIYTDNATRSTGGTSQMLLTVGLSGDASRDGPRLDYHLSSNFGVLKYLGGAYPTEPIGYLDGTLEFKVVPSFFSWILRDTFSQVQIDPYTPVTPDNLVSLNSITTGPRITMRPTLRTSVTLDALYSYTTSSSASPKFVNFDNHRYGGDLTIDRAFSESASLYLKGHYEKTDFKDQVDNNNFSIGEGSAGYRFTDGRTVLDLSGGYSQLRVYDVLGTAEAPAGSRETTTTETFEEPIWKADISRLITPSQRIALHASQQFADASSAFRLGLDQPVPTAPPPLYAATEPFKMNMYSVDWHVQGPRTTLVVSLSETRTHYLLNPGNLSTTVPVSDLESRWANVRLTRLLSPVLTWDIGVSLYRYEELGTPTANGSQVVVPGQSTPTLNALTDLHWQVGPRLALSFIYAYSRQSGVYAENQVGVTASWALLGARAGTMQPQALAPIAPASTMPQ
jgi:hypothetical protein